MKPLGHTLWLLASAWLLLPAVAAATTLYKSIGADGKVTYSDRPPVEGKIQKTLSFRNLPTSPLPESVVRYRQQLQDSAQRRQASTATRSLAGIRLFTARWCAYCRKAKAYLAEKDISYQEHDIDTAEGKQSYVQAGAQTGIPLLLANGQQVQAFPGTPTTRFSLVDPALVKPAVPAFTLSGPGRRPAELRQHR